VITSNRFGKQKQSDSTKTEEPPVDTILVCRDCETTIIIELDIEVHPLETAPACEVCDSKSHIAIQIFADGLAITTSKEVLINEYD